MSTKRIFSMFGIAVVVVGFAWLLFSTSVVIKDNTETVTVGIIYKGIGFKDVADGFVEALNAIATDGKRVEYMIEEVKGSDQKDFDVVAENMAARKVDLIFAVALEPIAAAKKATEKNGIPVVFALGGNPIIAGFVKDFLPEGNLTGVTWLAWELSGKRLEILDRIIPDLKNIVVIGKEGSKGTEISLQSVNSVAERLGILVTVKEISTQGELESAIASISHKDTDAIFYAPDPFLQRNANLFIKQSLKEEIPVMFHEERFVRDGATVAYGPNFRDSGKRAAQIAGKILFNGVSPKDIVVETISESYLSVNLVSAKAIGLDIPSEILSSADTVITE